MKHFDLPAVVVVVAKGVVDVVAVVVVVASPLLSVVELFVVVVVVCGPVVVVAAQNELRCYIIKHQFYIIITRCGEI